jgi:2-keto-4-pentenoate hydratase/2-oxohepta-3-ene-1,7-dioic acid hydratase in catechol pathway
MKLLACINDTAVAGGRRVEMMSDSSVIKDGRPFFVPAIASEWDYRIGVAFQITRMGKTVGERFARRYIGAMSLCVMPRPRVVDPAMAVGGDMLHSFDGAAIIGSWIDIPDDGIINVSVGDTTVTFSDDPLSAATPMVAQMSIFGTLKTGDIMIPVVADIGADFPENYIFTASLNGTECLKFKVK